ncbi:MAG TPA: flagellar biosynthesis protein FliQ [Firmicutes bacterium]|jgi:flagellar biosynthetic protein FliQ|nr:flagellar biosynthesis protein FliQ [Bacillota bacterium]HHT42805.1 flagellar biosynthesis protein FliQ [Bacillota bacterium]
MTDLVVVSIAREAVLTILLVAGPALGIGMLVGLLVSIFQATTQIQEQTLTFIPKIVAVLVSIVIFGPWMIRRLVDFAERLLGELPSFIM